MSGARSAHAGTEEETDTERDTERGRERHKETGRGGDLVREHASPSTSFGRVVGKGEGHDPNNISRWFVFLFFEEVDMIQIILVYGVILFF